MGTGWIKRELGKDGEAGKRHPGLTGEKQGQSGAVGPLHTS